MIGGGTVMDVSNLTTLISNVGFPIACVCALFYYIITIEKSHREETDRLHEVIDRNTEVLTKLYERVSSLED